MWSRPSTNAVHWCSAVGPNGGFGPTCSSCGATRPLEFESCHSHVAAETAASGPVRQSRNCPKVAKERSKYPAIGEAPGIDPESEQRHKPSECARLGVRATGMPLLPAVSFAADFSQLLARPVNGYYRENPSMTRLSSVRARAELGAAVPFSSVSRSNWARPLSRAQRTSPIAWSSRVV